MKILNLNEAAGFDAANWRTGIRIGRFRYRVQPEGVVAIKLAVKILWMAEQQQSLYSLRSDIRAVRQTLCRAALTHLISVTENEKLRLIAIWLRGQCGGYLGTEVLAKLSTSANGEAVRLKIAGALQRMSGWSVLERMAASDPSPRVRRRASSRAPREFRSCLHQYTGKSSSLPVAAESASRSRELYVAEELELTQSKSPKSVEFIRSVLERIRFLVRGRCEVG